MGKRWAHEPPYPGGLAEAGAACARLVGVLREHLGGRLVAVLLCGSWARGEARPPHSDLDLTAVVDTIDDAALDALGRAWGATGLPPVNVYGADEIPAMSREAAEMYTVNARVLWGTNPFRPPTPADLAEDLARDAERVARDGRVVALYGWLTPAERAGVVRAALASKSPFWRGLRTAVALRTGAFPRSQAALAEALTGMPEAPLVAWLAALTEADHGECAPLIGRRLSACARDWLRETLPHRRVPGRAP